MTNQQKPSKAIHITLWVVQVVLATSFIWAAIMKLSQPIEKLSAMWPWTGQVSNVLVKLIGTLDLLGAMGLILPSALRIKPQLTPWTALSIIALMMSAAIFHISRGEASVIGVNVVFAIMATFVAWGRFTKVPVIAK